MGKDTFLDFIPPGQDTGAQGSVFRDFVPDVQPQKKEEIKIEDVVEQQFICDVCQKVLSSKLALSGHKRSHK